MSQGGTYSQFDEDVILAQFIAQMPNGLPRTFVEIGCGDGSENNTRLLYEAGWWGEWYDADPAKIRLARAVKPLGTWCWKVTCEDFPLHRAQEFGVLSIDVDGNDYWLWRHAVKIARWRPWLVIIEAQIGSTELHLDPWKDDWVMPYDPSHAWDHQSKDIGATPVALIALGKTLGYEYLGKSENPHSPNLFFGRRDRIGNDRRDDLHFEADLI